MRRQTVIGEQEAVMLLRALQATDPSWILSSIEDSLWFFGVRRKMWVLSQGPRTFCYGYSLSKLLWNFVRMSRDRRYVSVGGFRLPGALISTVDTDDLVTRLKLLF